MRCVCGVVGDKELQNKPWIACDNSFVWQHNLCVGTIICTEDIPDTYLCEQCDPERHQELLGGLKTRYSGLGRASEAFHPQ